LSETVAFSGTTWSDSAPPSCAENANQFGFFGSQKVSANVWAAVTSWQVLTRANDGLNSAIVLYIEPDSVQLAVNDVCPLASFLWDGTKTCDLRDERPVSMFASAPHSSPVIAEGLALLASRYIVNLGGSPPFGSPTVWYVEDFREPRYMDATQSTLDRAWDGCRGRAPDGSVAKATYVSRPLVADASAFGLPRSFATVIVFGLPYEQHVGADLSKCVQSLQLRIFQGQGTGVAPAAITLPAPYFGFAVTPSSAPALPNGNIAINRVQVLLTTNGLGNLLKGIAVAIVSS
jgi:hypothetical protein